MNPTLPLLALALVCSAACGQTSTPAQTSPSPAIAPAAGETVPGTTGAQPQTQPASGASQPGGTSQTAGGQAGGNTPRTGQGGTSGRGNRRRRARGRSATSAPVGDSRIVVTGYPNGVVPGPDTKPLLQVATEGNAFGIQPGAPIVVTLQHSIDSGHAKNGDTVDGTLAQPLAGLPPGTPVQLTVVESSPAGQLTSYGELSLQVIRIADRSILSDTVTALGKEGAKELPDAAPARGTEAVFTAGQPYSLPAA